MDPYLAFVMSSVETLLSQQAARWGDDPDGTLVLAVTRDTTRSYHSMGGTKGKRFVGEVKEQPIEPNPNRLDMRLWPILDRLTEVTGDGRYRQMVDEMAAGFAQEGFDPASGLGYLGVCCEYDVVNRQPLPVMSYTEPWFKPGSDSTLDRPFAGAFPFDRLWTAAPEKMARMVKSAYYGLITRPENMDFNRFCYYGYDDAKKTPSLPFNSRHVGFAHTSSFLIHWWSEHFARTGDEECLRWAQAMTDKWHAVQHPETGLIPHAFASQQEGEPTQPPTTYINNLDTMTALTWLSAADALRRRPEGQALAEQLREMAVRLLRGFARHSYIREERLFPQWIDLDGRARRETTFYYFASQAEKDEEVKENPSLANVSVSVGMGFYTDVPAAIGVHNMVPFDVTMGAALTGDAELLAWARMVAVDLMEAVEQRTSQINQLGQWTYSASASYINMLIVLHRLTSEQGYLDDACRLADREMALLREPLPPGEPDWWRWPFRSSIIGAMLQLHEATAAAGVRRG